jgi:hypothetical protein
MRLTLQGEKALEWAKHVIADYESLQQSLSEMRRGADGISEDWGDPGYDARQSRYSRHHLPSIIPIRPSYAGDVWYPQPAPKDHPWRTMPHHGMTSHISGT